MKSSRLYSSPTFFVVVFVICSHFRDKKILNRLKNCKVIITFQQIIVFRIHVKPYTVIYLKWFPTTLSWKWKLPEPWNTSWETPEELRISYGWLPSNVLPSLLTSKQLWYFWNTKTDTHQPSLMTRTVQDPFFFIPHL